MPLSVLMPRGIALQPLRNCVRGAILDNLRSRIGLRVPRRRVREVQNAFEVEQKKAEPRPKKKLPSHLGLSLAELRKLYRKILHRLGNFGFR